MPTPERNSHAARWLLLLLVPVLLLAGIWLGGRPKDLPGFLHGFAGQSHEKLVIDEAIQRIGRDYYRPVSGTQLSNSSIAGIVGGLHDRFSHYLPPSELKEFNRPPHFAGIGVAVGPQRRGLLIARVFDSSPAARAGLKSGQLIVAVNGRRLKGLSGDAAVALIKGLPGTDVTLEVEGKGDGASPHPPLRTVKITRAVVSEPVVASATRTVNGKKLGVVALASFTPGAHAEVRKAVEQVLHEGAQGIVLDLRGNGGGLVEEAQLIASIFVPHGVIVSTRGRTQPSQTLVATVRHQQQDPVVSAGRPQHGLGGGDRHRGRRTTPARRSSAATRSAGRLQEEEKLANGGALTSPSASTPQRAQPRRRWGLRAPA
jgi:carboxyl-terminal processing protease